MSRFGMGLALMAAAVIVIAPVAARAETPVARVTLYEVDEALKLKPRGHDTHAVIARLAQASLLGVSGDVVALDEKNSVFKAGAFVKADASSNVSLATLVGPVGGTINLLKDDDPNRNSLDTLEITAVLDITAELDLRPTAIPVPMAPIAGRWRAHHGKARGYFGGVFLIPFSVDGGQTYYYLDPAVVLPGAGFTCKGWAGGGYCQVHSSEFVLGIPMTKALLTFSE